MKGAISTFEIKQNDISGNVESIINSVKQITEEADVDFILFPEDCFTCLDISDKPEQDLKLGRSLDSDEINNIRLIAHEKRVFISFGFLEVFDSKLYDSAIIIDDNGQIIHVHRRIHDGWFDPEINNGIYGLGRSQEKVETKHGSFTIIICGEITDESILQKTRNLKADFLLFLLLRASDNLSEDWLIEEIDYYTKQISKTNTLGFMVNGINYENNYFGGAWVVSPDGNILKEMNTQKEGYLLINIDSLLG